MNSHGTYSCVISSVITSIIVGAFTASASRGGRADGDRRAAAKHGCEIDLTLIYQRDHSAQPFARTSRGRSS